MTAINNKEEANKKASVKKAPAKKASVKKAPVKKAPVKKAPVKKVAQKKAPIKKAPAKKTETIKTETVKKEIPTNKKGFFKSLIDNVTETLDHVTENVVEGASFVTEKVKETTAKAYVASTELVEDANEKIHQFTDKQSLNKELHKLEEAQEELKHTFGALALENYLKKDNLNKAFLTTKKVNNVVEAYKENSKELLKIKKAIKTLDKI